MNRKLLLCTLVIGLTSFQVKSQIIFRGFNDIKPRLDSIPKDNIQEKQYEINFIGFNDQQFQQITKNSTIQIGNDEGTRAKLADISANNNLSSITRSGVGVTSQITFKITGKLSILPEGGTAILRFSDGTTDLGSLTLTYKKSTENPDGNSASSLTIGDLVNLTGLKTDALSIPSGVGCTGPDSPNPLDADKFNVNRIIYLADRNLTFFYKNGTSLYLIGNYKKNFLKGYHFNGTNLLPVDSANINNFESKRKIVVRDDQPLSFEIINVNPQAFDIEITDRADRTNIESNSLLELLAFGGGKAAAGAVQGKETHKITQEDKIRVAMYLYSKEIEELLLLLQQYCIYKQNDIIQFKLDAKKQIDHYFVKNLGKAAVQTISSFLAQSIPTPTEADTKLIDAFLKNYYSLPAAYYKNITQIPAVDGSYDKIAFVFSVKAKVNTPYKTIVSEKSVNAWTKGGFKVDVSTGLYYSGLQDEKYAIRADSTIMKSSAGADSVTDKRSQLYKESNGKGEFGFASFMHFYPKISPGFNISANIGAGVTFSEKTRIRYLAGLGFLIGQENRIAINAGYILGNVNKLSRQYADGDKTKLSYAEAGKEIVYTPKFSAQPFVSLTYNIPFIKKKDSITQQVDASNSTSAESAKADPAKKN
ncbi:hypothetical protein [[Flexibacter] sp. ATCC 35208]|uniref:hypothetical protein n=1 Tax=[Flexibacter] sp. ATCC 35208 TaxID=1936242 RepID=UPI0009C8D6E3|nr:hypothetical protein [[Flexibacter] sp. ATCC 35208]OMP75123.1 hypothetical protein BW716_31830 [[Flexibacter] sp. ATCC 35208]